MPFSSKYRLEAVCDKKSNLYSALEALSLTLKIAALILLIVFLRFFYIAIIVWGSSIPLNVVKRKLIYKYVYEIKDSRLIIRKAYTPEKWEILHNLDIITDINDISIEENGTIKYYDYPTEFNITVLLKEGESFSLAADKYFYGLMDYLRRGK